MCLNILRAKLEGPDDAKLTLQVFEHQELY